MKWRTVNIKDVCLLAVDCVNKTAPVVDYQTPYKMLRTNNIKGGFVDIENVKYVTEETFISWTRRSNVLVGDIILTREAPLGDVGRVTKTDNFFLGQRLFLYRPDPNKMDSNFLAYLLQSPYMQGVIKSKGLGATVQHAKVGEFENLKIPLPTFTIQKKIGFILASYDDLIENNRRRIQLLEESARLLYQEWFVRLNFPNAENTKIVDGVPEGWEKKQLKDVCFDVKDAINPDQIDYTTAYIGLEHMPRRSITLNSWDFSDKVISNKYKFQEDDIIFGKIRPYFHKIGFALCDGITSSDAVVIRPYDKNEYCLLLSYLSSDYFIALASKTVREGSKMPRADWGYLLKTDILIPNHYILESFNQLITPILANLKNLAIQNQKLAQARDLLLPKLMNGELEV